MSNNSKLSNELRIRNSTAEFLTFSYQSGGDGVEVRVQDGTIWLSQKNIGQLFDTSTDNTGLHLKNIYAENELIESATTEEFSVVQKEGSREVRRMVKHYNLESPKPTRKASLRNTVLFKTNCFRAILISS
ncbi:MAG: hypothetical protein FWG42_11245 [Clostridiales bacterium]|nr:hypothetical protein [Clostridiales bacterium]